MKALAGSSHAHHIHQLLKPQFHSLVAQKIGSIFSQAFPLPSTAVGCSLCVARPGASWRPYVASQTSLIHPSFAECANNTAILQQYRD